MADKKPRSSPPTQAERGPPKLYSEDIEQTGGHVFQQTLQSRLPEMLGQPPGSTRSAKEAAESQRTVPAPPTSQQASLAFPSEPLTVRHLEGEPTSQIPNLATSDEDGTSTDQTALMLDRSRRSGDRATLSVLTGLSAGQVIPLDKGTVTLGRGKEAHVVLRDPGISRVHARITSSDIDKYALEDLESTNGVRVNGVKVTRCVLRTGDRVQLGPGLVLQFGYLDDTEEALNKQLYEAATRDPLTQALNRRAFDERLSSEFEHARRHHTHLTLVLCDVDHFKRVNDSFGHPAGDRVLREIAQVVLREIRRDDLFARYGGEEFVIMVRGESVEKTSMLAERVRHAVKALALRADDGTEFRVTLSAGLASFHECEADASPEALISLADQRLYLAKESGRDRICLA